MDLLEKMKKFRELNQSKYISEKGYEILEYRSKEHNSDIRGEFQRDRDRVVHSRAFRRLSGKTQVFNSKKGDHYRTRLTHSLEVSQIGRTIGKVFGLNEDLIEAIALGHDLGHTPFGHVVERTLHDIIKNNEIEELKIKISGGFKHNFQSLHVVDNIEMGHGNKRGLNLTLAVRDGILKHTGFKIKSGKTGKKEEIKYESLNLGSSGINIMDYENAITLEGQIVALADEIAQSTHDLEDGVRSKIINIEDLRKSFKTKLEEIEVKIENKGFDEIQFHSLNEKLYKWISIGDAADLTSDANELIKILIDFFIIDAILKSKINIEEATEVVNSKGIVCECIIKNSKYICEFRDFISEYIYKNVVSSQEVSQSDSKAKYLIKQIFKAYYEDPRQLPDYALKRYFSENGVSLNRMCIMDKKEELQKNPRFIRMICDHIAGMTDSFAMEEYNNLYGVTYTL